MASVAIDVLDLNWRILQRAQAKPLTLRGRRWLRSRRHKVSRTNKLSSRDVALERMLSSIDQRRSPEDILRQLAEDSIPEQTSTSPTLRAYCDCAKEFEAQRILEEEEEIATVAYRYGLIEQARAARLAACAGYFEDEVLELEADPELSPQVAQFIADLDRQALRGLAAA